MDFEAADCVKAMCLGPDERRRDVHTTTELGGGFKYLFFHPYLGKIPILTNIFQLGGSTTNHTTETINYPLEA